MHKITIPNSIKSRVHWLFIVDYKQSILVSTLTRTPKAGVFRLCHHLVERHIDQNKREGKQYHVERPDQVTDRIVTIV